VRMLIVMALDPSGRGMVLPTTVVSRFFSGNWSDLSDYLEGLDQTGQDEAAEAIRLTRDSKMPTRNEESARTVLTYMPDGDYLTAVEIVLYADIRLRNVDPYLAAINGICKRRGVPYRLTRGGAFEWVGDPLTETEVLAPALSALDDPRLAGAPQDEFTAARAAMREGKPQSYQHAVAMACNAVESGLRVLLAQHGQQVPAKPELGQLLKACRAADLFPKSTNGKGMPVEHLLGAPGRFGNERGRHGAGEEPHDVQRDEAEAVVASAAVALTLIARRLPAQ